MAKRKNTVERVADEPNVQLIKDMASMSKDPYKWVLYSFDWGKGELSDFTGPDEWQKNALNDIGTGLKTIGQVIQEATASGHGIGKSALVAWIILWALSTFEDTKGIVTANTETQLKTKTWAELAKWYRLFIAKDWFEFTATAIYSKDPEHEKTWRLDMVAWSEHKTEAFAGMHNKGKRIVIIFDEASAIPDPIWDVTQGALTDENTEIMWFVFGNPTRNTGRFCDCFGKNRHRWTTRQIDSRTAKMTNKAQIQKWVEDYGEDSDYVRVRVRGVFPNTSDKQFIPANYVEMARTKSIGVYEYQFAPKIIGVDPAWGGDDEIAIMMRQGNCSRLLAKYRGIKDDMVIAGYVAKFEDDEQADAVFIDLGYGTGIYSAGKQLGREWILVPFGGASTNPGLLNKRTDMWDQMKQWLKNGGTIPNDPVLCGDLTAPEYYVVMRGPQTGKVNLESKEDMKARGLPSPNRADALALTFAMPVRAKKNHSNPSFSGSQSTGTLEFAKGTVDIFA